MHATKRYKHDQHHNIEQDCVGANEYFACKFPSGAADEADAQHGSPQWNPRMQAGLELFREKCFASQSNQYKYL